MRDYVHEHFRRHLHDRVRPSLITGNGKSLSVQGSQSHYCTPNVDMQDTYSHVEVWCWPKRTRFFNKWVSYEDNPAGWVPVEEVNKWIHRNGGLSDVR